jgi:5-methoxy-6-methylbenzimidazole methyltransferase
LIAEQNRRKVVLVVPPLIHAGVAFTSVAGPEHIGIAYLAASLRRQGVHTDILNFDLDTYLRVMRHEGFADRQPRPEEMADKILEKAPDFVGVTVTGPTLETSLALSRVLKQRHPALHVCFGGHQATAAAEPLMSEEPTIDSIGVGDCDFTLPEFVKRLWTGDSLSNCYGFYSRDLRGALIGGWKPDGRKGDLIRVSTKPLVLSVPAAAPPAAPAEPVASPVQKYALWDLPFPARDDLEVIREKTGANEARLSTSRGCMDFCTFCATSDSAGFRRHTLRPPDDVIQEIEALHSRYDIDHFWLVDDNFVSRSVASQERAEEICRSLAMNRMRVTMRAYFRADAFEGRPDLIPLLFRAGVIMGLIGVESATPRRLQYFGKHCTPDQVRSTIQAIRSVGMGLQIGYIFFDPLTSFPDMRADADFLQEIGEAYNLFNFVQSMDVYPGTPYRRMIQAKGLGHFSHPYRGGFRDYEYADARIGPLAAAIDRLYTPVLMASDRDLMRLRAFNLPRLRWLDEQDLVPDSDRPAYLSAREEAEELLATLAHGNWRWMHAAIDNAEAGLDGPRLEASLADMLAERRDCLARLESLAALADALASRLHAMVNGRTVGVRAASGNTREGGASWCM